MYHFIQIYILRFAVCSESKRKLDIINHIIYYRLKYGGFAFLTDDDNTEKKYHPTQHLYIKNKILKQTLKTTVLKT